MTTKELRDHGAIFFEKITEGFRDCAYIKLVLDEKKALNHFKSLKKEYGADNSFADFYYYRLDEDARGMVDELLTAQEQSYLKLLKPDSEQVEDEIIFPLDDELLKIIVKLNAQEMLFSTIYFVSGKSTERSATTWWGNYGHEYICFRDK